MVLSSFSVPLKPMKLFKTPNYAQIKWSWTLSMLSKDISCGPRMFLLRTGTALTALDGKARLRLLPCKITAFHRKALWVSWVNRSAEDWSHQLYKSILFPLRSRLKNVKSLQSYIFLEKLLIYMQIAQDCKYFITEQTKTSKVRLRLLLFLRNQDSPPRP